MRILCTKFTSMPFAMGSTTVTNRQYRLFAEATGEVVPPTANDACFNDPSKPVVAVTWFNAMAYCKWLSQETGFSFRLPTEAEWEWAVRDGQASGSVCLGQRST